MTHIDIIDSWDEPQSSPQHDYLSSAWCPVVCIDGAFVDIAEGVATAECSVVEHALSFSITFVTRGTEPFLWREVYLSILAKARALRFVTMSVPSSEKLRQSISLLISKNKYPPFSRMRLTFWQHGRSQMDTRWLLVQERLKQHPYAFAKDPLVLDDRPERLLFPSPLTEAGVLPVDVLLMHRDALFGNRSAAIVRNTQGDIATTTIGNIYFMNGRNAVTPSLASGARNDVMHAVVVDAMRTVGYNCQAVDEVNDTVVQNSHDCLVADASYGVRCVSMIGAKVFHIDGSREVAHELSSKFFS